MKKMVNENEIQTEKSLVVSPPDIQGTVQVLEQFSQLKIKVLSPDDFVVVEGKKYIKKSGWRKISLAFNVSTEIVDVQHEEEGDDYTVVAKARAVAPNGRTSEDVASCSKSEFMGNRARMATKHNIRATAVTRAINRAISGLVGGGEVSAEEILAEPEINEIQSETSQTQPPGEEKITLKQLNFLRNLMQNQDIADLVNRELNGTPIEEISKSQASKLLDKIKQY